MKKLFVLFALFVCGLLFSTGVMAGPTIDTINPDLLGPRVRIPATYLRPTVINFSPCVLHPELCGVRPGTIDLGDADGDGVINIEDDCRDDAGTEATDGCPDADVDGIADSEDTCDITRDPVVTTGCPDTDADTIVDDLDDCEDTATGDLVDEFGCTIEAEVEDGDAIDDEVQVDYTSLDGPGLGGSEAWGDSGCSLAPGASGSNAVTMIILAISLLPVTIRRKIK